jgi:hypothetical protein
MRVISRALAVAWLLIAPTAALAQSAPPPVTPQFLLPTDTTVNDYRPVVNAAGTAVIFERTFVNDDPPVTKLHHLDLTTLKVTPFVNMPSMRPDWCWLRANNGLVSIGPVAFSNDDGIYVVPLNGMPTLLRNTQGMVYPSWYPDCLRIAADVATTHVTAEINATTGAIIQPMLAQGTLWAGFPSVNQASPNFVAFAGMNNQHANYYNQDINYIWVTNTLIRVAAPLERRAPPGPSFMQIYQARAGWWSPDGKWFAFESNRSDRHCNNINGNNYAIFIQDALGVKPAMQVTDCQYNAQHPKWFPTAATPGKTVLIVAADPTGDNQFALATLDVTAFVTGQ